jgi:hypothetical protein
MHKRGDVGEQHGVNAPLASQAFGVHDRMDHARRCVEHKAHVSACRVPCNDQVPRHRDRGGSDDAVSADGRKPAPVHEQNPGVRFGRDGLREHPGDEIGMAARLEDERAPDAIRAPAQPRALVAHRAPRRVRHTVNNQAQCLAADVRIHGLYPIDHAASTRFLPDMVRLLRAGRNASTGSAKR